jgi:integrase
MIDQPELEPKTVRTRRRKQNSVGTIFKSNGAWFVRYYTGETFTRPDGKTGYKQASVRLGSTDEIRNKDAARGRANDALKPLTSKKGVAARSDTTVGQYLESVIKPWWSRSLKPSTQYGYEKVWRLYLKPSMENALMAEYMTVDAGNFLDKLALDGLNGTSIAHARSVANQIFGYAATKGVIPFNPFRDAKITERIKESEPTHKYSMEEIRDILIALRGNLTAQTAVGLTFFGGLRPGEARAAKWENYNGATLRIETSVWRKHETAPKTKESIQDIPIVFPLVEMLKRLNAEQGSPPSGYVLRGARGGPQNLDQLARLTIKPLLALAGIVWHGYYSCRRGLATVATDAIKDPTGAAGLLRHKTIDTTAAHYIGITKDATVRAMAEVERLYSETCKQLPSGDNCAASMQQPEDQVVESTMRRDA